VVSPALNLDQTPHRQFIRFRLSRSFLEQRIKQRGLGSVSWRTVPLNQLGLRAALESRDRTFRINDELQDVTTAADLQQQSRAAAVQIQRKKMLGTGRPPIPPEYRVAKFHTITKPRRIYHFALIEYVATRKTWQPVTPTIAVDLSKQPPVKLLVSEVDFSQAKRKQGWMFLELPLIQPMPAVQVNVSPAPLHQAVTDKQYLITVRATGIPRGVSKVKCRFEFPQSGAAPQRIEQTENVINGQASLGHRIAFAQPVSGTARILLFDVSTGRQIGKTVQLPVAVRARSKSRKLCFAAEKLGPMNPAPWLTPNMSGREGGIPWACYQPEENIVLANNLQITGPDGGAFYLASDVAGALRLPCSPDGVISLPGTADDRTSYKGKVEVNRITLEVEYHDPASPDSPPVRKKWVFDK
jgi:hypothetical protein